MSEQALALIASLQTAVAILASDLSALRSSVSTVQQAAQAAADLAGSKGKVITRSDEPAIADRLPQILWIDTTNNVNTPKRWNGTTWVPVTDKVASDAAAASASAMAVAATKADDSAVAALAARVTACEGQVTASGSQVAPQGVPIAALGHAVADPGSKAECTAISRLTSRFASEDESTPLVDHSGYVTGEKPARQAMEEVFSRAKADLALAKRIGSFECKFPEGTVKATLAADVPSDEQIKGEALFVVIDDQVFISNATIKDSVIDPARISVKVAVNEQGQYYVAGVGLGASRVTSGLKLGPDLEEDVRRLLREELKPGGILHRY
ncbi:hypothetical protein WCE04_09035 [Pseudomonas shirazica]|uniref:hypothetical protein n=1 Tax=Pseudomonas shirazica TaxID=1940636 RepID=UPI0034D76E4E